MSRLARPSLRERDITIHTEPADRRLFARADLEQLQRALLTLVFAGTAGLRDTRIDFRLAETASGPVLTLTIHGVDPDWRPGEDIFEPFASNGRAPGLALATARQLVHNQGGRLHAEWVAGALQFVVAMPPTDPARQPEGHPEPAHRADTPRVS